MHCQICKHNLTPISHAHGPCCKYEVVESRFVCSKRATLHTSANPERTNLSGFHQKNFLIPSRPHGALCVTVVSVAEDQRT